MKYKLIESISSISIITMINEEMKRGWEQLGGISIAGDYHGVLVYCQAMTTNNMNLKIPVEHKFAID